jgi:hypothetical protein
MFCRVGDTVKEDPYHLHIMRARTKWMADILIARNDKLVLSLVSENTKDSLAAGRKSGQSDPIGNFKIEYRMSNKECRMSKLKTLRNSAVRFSG